MPVPDPQRFRARLERHHPDLPVYLLVPAEVPAALGQSRTFVVEARIDGTEIGRRSVKPWAPRDAGDERWFLELTKAQCARLGVAPGDALEVVLTPARAVPEELEVALVEAGLTAAWAALSAAERRSIAESIFATKRPATRVARIGRALAALRERSR